MKCKYCQSPNIVKFGTYNGEQRYWCKDCQHKFKNDDSLYGGRVSAGDISSALLEYYSGMSINDIRDRIKQEKHYLPAVSTVYQWIDKYTDKAVDYYSQFQPKVGDEWVADETVINIGGKDVWLWDVIDSDTRFLLASKLSYSRNTSDAKTLFELAYKRVGKAPKVILTDRLRTYPEAIAQVFGELSHKQSSPFVSEDSTRKIERWHETLKERTKVIYGLRDANSALAFIDGFLVYYNFMRPHDGLNNKTPAEVAGIKYDVKNWADVTRLNEPTQTHYEYKPEYSMPPELTTRRRIVTGKPYKVGRKRKPKTIPRLKTVRTAKIQQGRQPKPNVATISRVRL